MWHLMVSGRAPSELGIEPVIDADEVINWKFDEIVVALDDRRGMLPMEFLLQFKQRGVPVTDLVDFLERETEYLDLDILRPSWLLYEKSSETSLIYRLLKRAFDVFFGMVLLVLTLPLTVAGRACHRHRGWYRRTDLLSPDPGRAARSHRPALQVPQHACRCRA